MFWSIVLVSMVASSVASLRIKCQDDEQCTVGKFCEVSVKLCRQCLDCVDFKRELPPHFTPATCVKSISECGSCLQGLVLDHQNDVNMCVTPDGRDDGTVLPAYGWALIVIGILFLALVVVMIIVYVLRNPDSFKILASTRTSFRSPGIRVSVPANVPDAPPPYNPHYEAVRPDSPSTYPLPAIHIQREEETAQPFIKRAPSSRPQDQRESGDNQSAVPYELPVYLRTEQPDSPDLVTIPEAVVDVQDNNNFEIHDEDTMESNWTSNINDNKSIPRIASGHKSGGSSGTDDEGAVENSMALALRKTLTAPPPAKKLRTSQDTNNNMNRDSSAVTENTNTTYPSTPHSQTAFVINVQVNNNK